MNKRLNRTKMNEHTGGKNRQNAKKRVDPCSVVEKRDPKSKKERRRKGWQGKRSPGENLKNVVIRKLLLPRERANQDSWVGVNVRGGKIETKCSARYKKKETSAEPARPNGSCRVQTKC